MFKFLAQDGCTYRKGHQFVYNLPRRGEKWAFTEHPEPLTEPDGFDCGPGGLHLMKKLDARYAPHAWWPWWGRPAGITLGESEEKIRSTAVELCRISPQAFWRMLRLGWGKDSYLTEANLYAANLVGANLYGAYLYAANLAGANLVEANLVEAYLVGANLVGANLDRANLDRANLCDGF